MCAAWLMAAGACGGANSSRAGCSAPNSNGANSAGREPSDAAANTEERAASARPDPTASASGEPAVHVPDGATTARGSAEDGACQRLRDEATFVSREAFECGPPVEGYPPARCHSRITFQASSYEWRHTDMVFAGEYTCSDGRIEAEDHRGTFDAARALLLWEGAEYVPASQN